MATMTRAFTIFRDEPEAPVANNKDGVAVTTTVAVPPPSGPLLVYAPDKENVDPCTGSHALSEHQLGKKRKTTLAAKAQPASPTKKARPLAEKPTKKASTKSRSSSDKKTKRSSTRTNSTRTRREPSLPRLLEEGEDHEALTQVVIDAKCKELTVLPLADISEAYEQTAAKDGLVEAAEKAADETVRVALSLIIDVERPATPPPSSIKEDVSSSPIAASTVDSVFSTPERKRIYSSFTFSSPSSTGQRYASARGSSVERFADVIF
ncbi:hypothetical protein C8Q80DRAFT_1261970 [Daedaleopsis nitida]|nr:hypothetical protein C8Q80DRAFT_1261970 [Daedaleopsis nitida]